MLSRSTPAVCAVLAQPLRSFGVTHHIIFDQKRRVIGEARLTRDRAGAGALADARGRDLVIDSPTDVVRARGSAVGPPRVFHGVGLGHPEAVQPAMFGCGGAIAV